MPSPVTERCSLCRTLLVPQTSSQTCLKIPKTKSSEERASSPTTAFMAWTSLPMA
ncbi:hypothetical protein HanXRQr2_Chr05g0219531 [Helianthus annuus]|uniref:Uncharacterized protein n=1 Tax=Helianthus annuus TaxID=4232 RepID=A0A9K3J0M0_HELAN|nr:hypothetical protein HanXRQr2_Chr05g0219531 [Helianthus annuus]